MAVFTFWLEEEGMFQVVGFCFCFRLCFCFSNAKHFIRMHILPLLYFPSDWNNYFDEPVNRLSERFFGFRRHILALKLDFLSPWWIWKRKYHIKMTQKMTESEPLEIAKTSAVISFSPVTWFSRRHLCVDILPHSRSVCFTSEETLALYHFEEHHLMSWLANLPWSLPRMQRTN